MPAPPSRFASSAAWWAISLAACAISFIGLTDEGFSPRPGSTASYVLWFSLAVVVAGLFFEAWRDLFETAKHLAWLGCAIAVFAAFVGLSRPTPLALGVAGGGALVWFASVAYRRLNQRAVSPWPDVLLQQTEEGAIHEASGVQFTAAATAHVVGGDACDVEFTAQNCFDAPRTIHLALEPEGKVADANRAVLVPHEVKAELGPGEVVKVTLHCVAAGRAQGEHSYLWRVVTLGRGGLRVRRRRAPSLSVPLLTQLISLFSALSMGARGRKVTFVITPSQSEVLKAHPTFRVESVWKAPVKSHLKPP